MKETFDAWPKKQHLKSWPLQTRGPFTKVSTYPVIPWTESRIYLAWQGFFAMLSRQPKMTEKIHEQKYLLDKPSP